MQLSVSEFHEKIDLLQQQIEDILDDSDADIDIENSGGILTLEFENSSQIILSRQEALRQLWVATRQGGFHFDYQGEQGWVCDANQQNLGELLSQWCQAADSDAPSFPSF